MTRTGLWANMNSRQQKVYIEVSFSSSSKHFFHGQNIGDPSSQMCRLQCSWWDPQPALTCESRGRGPKYDNSSPNEKKKKKTKLTHLSLQANIPPHLSFTRHNFSQSPRLNGHLSPLPLPCILDSKGSRAETKVVSADRNK